MHLIDPRTVILLTGVMSGLMSVVLFSLKRAYPQSIKGLSTWATALMALFLAGVMAVGRGTLPDVLSMSVANYLLGAGLYGLYLGSQRFFGVTPRPLPWIAFITSTWALQVWFTYGDPLYQMRLATSTLVAAFLFTVHAHLLFKQGGFTLAKGLAFWVIVNMVVLQLLRFWASWVWPVGNDVMDTSLHHVVYVTTFAFFNLLFSISLVLMASDQLRSRLEHMATHDSLTNSLTRRQINEVCTNELERCKRNGRCMALLMMDLDHFKQVNDSFGHPAGDQVLVFFVDRVNALLRRPDRLGRFGGEEFLVVLPETLLDEAVSVANRIREICPMPDSGPACTVSIGVTTNSLVDDTVESMLARADAALYRAKDKGRNRVEIA
jgi:diguanylate cyclase (GGDEF)-like protein